MHRVGRCTATDCKVHKNRYSGVGMWFMHGNGVFTYFPQPAGTDIVSEFKY